tara:strand:- start:101224 stop:101370 length:147 start_codon:yes stop_codon:yes gene_type:complete
LTPNSPSSEAGLSAVRDTHTRRGSSSASMPPLMHSRSPPAPIMSALLK